MAGHSAPRTAVEHGAVRFSTLVSLGAFVALIYFGAAYVPVGLAYLKAVHATEELLRDARQPGATLEPLIAKLATTLRDELGAEIEAYEIAVARDDEGRPRELAYTLRLPVRFPIYGPERVESIEVRVGKSAPEEVE